jgi:hypothetical protein
MSKAPKKQPVDPKQVALAKIKGLTIGDCTTFLDSIVSDRDKKVADMVHCGEDGEFECDNYIISEGDDNGAYVMGWRWVDFSGSDFDKRTTEEKEEDGE